MSENIFCPAKINLFLKIYEKNASGFHKLDTLMVKLDWGDDIQIECEPYHTSDIVLKVPGFPELENENNLIYRAVEAYQEKTTLKFRIKMILNKNSFVAAGLGGGSSNAGSILKYLNQNFLKLERAELLALAGDLGTDVPFFVDEASLSWATNLGKTMIPARCSKRFSVLLINPGIEVSTSKLYRALNRGEEDVFIKANSGHDVVINNMRDFLFYAQKGNDFQKQVELLYPEVKQVREALNQENATYVQMSGSGATVFGIYKNDEIAKEAQKSLKKKWNVIMTHTAFD